MALVLLVTALAIPNVAAVASPIETAADDFASGDYTGDSGTLSWATPWIETGEIDGSSAGSIQVRNEPHCETDPCLTLGRDAGPDAAVERAVDLTGYTVGVLTFDYKIHEHGTGAGVVSLEVSPNDGTDWYPLDSWQLDTDTELEEASYDISTYLGLSTRIRFSITGNTDDSHLNVDNLVIATSLTDTPAGIWYLKGDGVPLASLGDMPTRLSLLNHDTSRDNDPGLSLKKSNDGLDELDPDYYQMWVTPSFGGLELDGSATLTFWSAMKDFHPTKDGSVIVGLYDCRSDATDCSLLSQQTLTRPEWGGGSSSWVEDIIDFGTVTGTIAAGRSLAVKFVNDTGSQDDIWLAYDSVNYPSRLTVTPMVPSPDPANVLISEFSTSHPDFVEIYNAGDTAIDINGFVVSVNEPGPLTRTLLVDQGGSPVILPPGGHYLVVEPGQTLSASADQILPWSGGLDPDTGISVADASSQLLDSVGAQGTTIFEGTALPSQVDGTIQSYERLASNSLGNCQDTDDNIADFVHNWGFSDPQNLSDPPVVCGTAGPGSSVVISEFRPEGPAGSDDEFIELFNPTPAAVDISGWIVHITEPGLYLDYHVVPGGTILDPGEHYLLSDDAGPAPADAQPYDLALNYAAGWGDVLLKDQSGTIVDILGYGDPIHGQSYEDTPLPSYTGGTADRSFERRHGGYMDTFHNRNDFVFSFAATPEAGTPSTNEAPVFDQDLLDRTNAEWSLVSIDAGATDADVGDTLAYGATGLPPGVTIDTASGLISGTIDYTAAAASPYSVTITATDDGSPNLAATPDTFTWTVTETNRVPVLTNPGPQTTPELIAFSLDLSASDPDGQVPSFGDGGTLPGWATLIDHANGSATILGVPGAGDSGTTTVTITVSDGGVPDLTDTVVFDITVSNVNQPPSIVNPGDQTGAEGAPFSVALSGSDPDGTTVGFSDSGTLPSWATLTDNGDDTATISGTPAYDDAATTTVTITATDGSLTAETTFDITISNTNRPPVVEPVASQTTAEGTSLPPINITSTDPDGTIPSLAASGLPGWTSFLDNGDGTATLSGTPGYSDSGASAVTISTSDGSLTATTTFTLTVTETNRPPAFDADLGNRSDAEGSLISLAATATDPDLGTLSYSATGLPSGLAIEPSSGHISGTIDYEASGIHNVQITVGDTGAPALADTDSFIWTVTDTNRVPVLEPITALLGSEGTPLTFEATAIDPDEDPVAYSIAGAPAGAAIDPTSGIFTWTPTELQGPGSYAITVIATDNGSPALTTDATLTITVVEANSAPTVDPIGDRNDIEGNSVNLTVTANDPDVPMNALNYEAIGLPQGLTINPATGQISGTLATGSTGQHDVSIVVTDDGDPQLAAVTSFTWVVGTPNRPPILSPLNDLRVEELAVISFGATASDLDGDTTTYSLLDAPDGATIDATTGVFTWTPSEAQGPGAHSFTVRSTDNGTPQLSDADNITIVVAEVNQAPALLPVPNRIENEGTEVSFGVQATDPDLPENTMTYSATGLPPGLTIDPISGTIHGTIDTGPAETIRYEVMVTVSDGGLPTLTATTGFTWTVSAAPEEPTNGPPEIGAIDDQYVDAGSPFSLPVHATDTEPLTFTARGLPAGMTIDPVTGIITGTPGDESIGTHPIVVEVIDSGDPVQSASVAFDLTVTNRTAADEKVDLVVAIGGDEEVDEVTEHPVRRSLVVMSSAAAATSESMRLPMALLLALMIGFATVGRIGLYPLLWRGDRHVGTISFFDRELEFGLIDPDEGGEPVFVHANAFPRRQHTTLTIGTRIRYRVLAGDNRASAWGATTELGK